MSAIPTIRTPVMISDLGWQSVAAWLRVELRAELDAAIEEPGAIARIAFVVREDGVSKIDRDELVSHYRRHGLRELALRVRAVSPLRACAVLEGDTVTVLSLDPHHWLRETP